MKMLSKKPQLSKGDWIERSHKGSATAERWTDRLGDSFLLICVLAFAALVVAAFAVAAPLILAVSALFGLIARNSAPKAWRPVRIR